MGNVQGLPGGATAAAVDKGSVREVIGPDTEAGQALLIAAFGFAILLVTVGRGEAGVVGKVGKVLETIAVIAAASWVAQYAARSYSATHPDGPLADGFRIVA